VALLLLVSLESAWPRCLCSLWQGTGKVRRVVSVQFNEVHNKFHKGPDTYSKDIKDENKAKWDTPTQTNMRMNDKDVNNLVDFERHHLLQLSKGNGVQRGSMWPRGRTSCWWMCTTKTRVMPFIPTKSDACTSTS
jgi:hypothetical protein